MTLHVAATQGNADDVRELRVTGALRVVVGERRVEIVADGETPDDIGGGLAALKGADEPAVPRCDGLSHRDPPAETESKL